ncbi:MAG: hypothetical protein ACE5F1_17530 [Planctomycetota bacterium]
MTTPSPGIARPLTSLPLWLAAMALSGSPRTQDAIDARAEPSVRYVDSERAQREARLTALSTARLGPRMGYRLSVEDQGKVYRIAVRTEVLAPGDLCFVMPSWAPGSYHLGRQRKLDGLRARDGQGASRVPEALEDRNVWTLKNAPEGELLIEYSLSARRFRRGRRSRDKPCQQFDGPSVWMHEIRHKDLPCDVEVRLPEAWDIATGLDAREGTLGGMVKPGTWSFRAADYDVLIDCPTRMGFFESFGFKIGNTPFEIAICGAERDRTDRNEFGERVKRISEHFIEMFGGAPFERYVYLFTVPGGGGLEHLNSTAIGMMGLAGSKPGKPVLWDFVIAHEFFHAWNVKRLRPHALGPFDYSGPNRTTALWLSEGVTSYYGALALARIGLCSPRGYWRHIARKYSQLRRNPVRREISVADSSWKVWDGSPFLNRKRIDYYLKGECLGLLLDIEIRGATGNEKSLDDVMRALFEQCRRDGRGFLENDVRETCNRVSGIDLGTFFDKYVYGTEDLPVRATLGRAGLSVELKGEGRKARFTIEEDDNASGLALSIRRALLGKD